MKRQPYYHALPHFHSSLIVNSDDEFEAATQALAWSRDLIKLMLGRRIEEYWLRSRFVYFSSSLQHDFTSTKFDLPSMLT